MAHSEDVVKLLQQELVTEKDGRFFHGQTIRCRIPTGAPVYLERHIEAPSDLISRDNAVYVSTRVLFSNRVFLLSILNPDITLGEAVSYIPCRPSEPPEAGPDFTVSIIMAREGMRIVTTDTKLGDTAVDNLTWAQVLGIEEEQ